MSNDDDETHLIQPSRYHGGLADEHRGGAGMGAAPGKASASDPPSRNPGRLDYKGPLLACVFCRSAEVGLGRGGKSDRRTLFSLGASRALSRFGPRDRDL